MVVLLTDELTDKEKAIELYKCQQSFPYFLRYCKIVEPPTPESPGGIIDYEWWPLIHQPLVNGLLNNRLLVVIKCRQASASYTVVDYVLWNMYKHGSKWMFFSRGEIEVVELIDKMRRTHRHLPQFLQLKLGHDSAMKMLFPDKESGVEGYAATKAAGISFTASGILCDEWDYHPFAAENFLNAKPAIDAGGQFIGMTTVDILNPGTLAKVVYKNAPRNGFAALFFPFDVRPGRNEGWYQTKKLEITEEELGGLSRDLYMFQNYPRSIEEAFSVPQTISAFDVKVLSQMMEDTKNPVKVEAPDIDFNIVHIYKPFCVGNYYIASSDASHGVGEDYSITVVMNVKTGEVVADIMSPLLSPEELAWHSIKLLSLYRNPLWLPEDNEWGRIVITTAQKLGYKNFGYQDKAKTKEGWHTDKESRFELFGNLIPGINNRQITIYNKDGIKQFYDVIRNADKAGRIEAMRGRHDDYPVAVGICWAKRDEVTTEEWKPQTITTLHFRKRGKGGYRARIR